MNDRYLFYLEKFNKQYRDYCNKDMNQAQALYATSKTFAVFYEQVEGLKKNQIESVTKCIKKGNIAVLNKILKKKGSRHG